jgi:uncharacterized protein YcbX
MSHVARITIYPVKSLDGLEVEAATVLESGGLEHDRRWRLVDPDGRVVNAKRVPGLAAIRAAVDPCAGTVHLAIDPGALAAGAAAGLGRPEPATFPLVPGPHGPCDWFAAALGLPVLLQERADGGFPDDRDAAGPTVVATATLVAVAGWFGLDLEECRRRFRANLEIDGWEAFAEDELASPIWPGLEGTAAWSDPSPPATAFPEWPPPEPREFEVDGVVLRATGVCRRCPVPTRHSRTGLETPRFRDIFESRRRQTLRAGVDVGHWNGLYRLTINTVLAGTAGSAGRPGRVRVGGLVSVRDRRQG